MSCIAHQRLQQGQAPLPSFGLFSSAGQGCRILSSSMVLRRAFFSCSRITWWARPHLHPSANICEFMTCKQSRVASHRSHTPPRRQSIAYKKRYHIHIRQAPQQNDGFIRSHSLKRKVHDVLALTPDQLPTREAQLAR